VIYPLVPLRELGEIVSGSTPDTSRKEYWDGDIPWITPADLTDHNEIFFTKKLRKITEKGYKSCSTSLIPSGSLLFSSRAPIGHCAITTYPLCTNQGFKNLIPNEKLDSVFGYFALRFFTPRLEALGRGATFTEINKEIFGSFCIPLPPLPEQQRIATILQKADQIRRLRRYARQLSDGYLQSVFLEMFGDPVTNPKGWKTLKASQIFDIQLGKMRSEKEITGKYLKPYLRNVNVQWGYLDLSDIKEMDFTPNEMEKYRLQQGDILVCEGGEVGRTAIYNGELDECGYQNALHRLRAKNHEINSDYFIHYMKVACAFGVVSKLTSQVTIAHFTAEKFAELEVMLAPLKMQNEFSEICQKTYRLQKRQKEAERQAEQLFQSLLHQAFELR